MSAPASTTQQATQLTWKVDGMTCANCAQGIRNVLVKKGLSDTEVNFAAGEVNFTLIEGFSEDQVQADIEKLGYVVTREEEEAKPAERFSALEKRFAFCFVFTLPLLAHMFVGLAWLHNPWVQLALCIPVMLGGWWFFAKSGWSSLKTGVPNMDVLVSIGSLSAFLYSLIGTTIYIGTPEAHHYLFYETAATIITLVLLGNILEQRSVRQTGSALRELAALQPEMATRISMVNGVQQEEQVSASSLRIGDVVRVTEGSRIPADGTVLQGEGLVDESMMSGESLPVNKQCGEAVLSGTLNISGNFSFTVTRNSKQTALAGILNMVRKAQNDKPPVQKLGDRISAVFVPVVLGIALITAVASYLFGLSVQDSLMHAIAVLVISCPCAMGLATPTAVMAGLGRAASKGVLFRSGTDAEIMAKAGIWAFDKTGTLTTGDFKLGAIKVYKQFPGLKTEEIILALEQASSHPIARSLCKALQQEQPAKLQQIKEVKGFGMQGQTADGQIFRLGSARIVPENVSLAQNHTLYLTCNDELWAGIDLNDELKADAASTIAALKREGLKVVMISGDSEERCAQVAGQAGIDTWYSACLPQQKLDIIAELKKQGKVVMVGDGINDAPALNAADVSVSPASASSIAIHSAGVILTSEKNLSGILTAFSISKLTLKTIRQNLFWAFFYNVVAIPIAAIGLLSPMIAAFSMAFSDVIVIGNSIYLKIRPLPKG